MKSTALYQSPTPNPSTPNPVRTEARRDEAREILRDLRLRLETGPPEDAPCLLWAIDLVNLRIQDLEAML